MRVVDDTIETIHLYVVREEEKKPYTLLPLLCALLSLVGIATVSGHAMLSGHRGNLPPYAINSVVGSSVYVRNLSPFTGGRDAYSVKYATAQDKQTALLRDRDILLSKSIGLHSPCAEDHVAGGSTMIVTWRCQFVQPPH